ncbi:MAG: lytic transglycosylase domain-containing protein [Myxococcota bacterium]
MAGQMQSAATALAAAILLVGLAGSATGQIYSWTDASGSIHFTDDPRHEGFSPHELKPVRPMPLASRFVPTRAWDGLISRMARKQSVSPALVKAVIHAESAFNPRAVSRKGAMGLMQLMPETSRELGVDDPFNPWQNIAGGTRYLRAMLQLFPGDPQLALAAYNAGVDTVKHYRGIPPFPETRTYVKRVMNLYKRYHADFR